MQGGDASLEGGSQGAVSPTRPSVKGIDPGPTVHSTELERDVLVATKLHLPRLRQGFMPRPRLRAHVADAASCELTLVCTPAGFGKTTTLVDWAQHVATPAVRWLALDGGDNDPARFWRYIAAALEPHCVGLQEQLSPLLAGPGTPSLEAVVARLVNALAAQPGQVVLVLDDYHVIATPDVHRSLGLLLERLPAQLRLIVASRVDPPLPLARLRARGQLGELRATDLRFTPDEAAEFVRLTTGLELDPATIEALTARTEGWVAGLQLASLSLQGSPDPVEFVATFTGSHRYVLDFLTEEVLAQQPEPRARFLLETSVLNRLCASLCDAVTGTANSQERLEDVERHNLFLLPLDEVRGWWRYHHLFADLLRARLQREYPERVGELHRRAAAWFEARGLVEEALHHARAANDVQWAAGLVEAHAQALLMRNEMGTVRRWLAELPADVIRQRPRLGVTSAVCALIAGRGEEEVEPILVAAEQAYARQIETDPTTDGDRPVGDANVPAMLGILQAELARQRGDAERTLAATRGALAHVRPDDRFLRFVVGWNAAVAMLMQGRVGDAEPALAEILADRRAVGDTYDALRASYTLCQAQRARGSLRAAQHTAQDALSLVRGVHAGPDEPPIAGIAHLALAEVLREQGDLDAALEHATRGVELVQDLGYAQWVVSGLSTLGSVQQARGELAAAGSALRQAQGHVPRPESATDLVFPAAVQQARLWLAQGEIDAAAEWTRQHAVGEDDEEPSFARERAYLVLVRVLLAQRRLASCLGLLRRLEALAADQRRGGSLVEIWALGALALAGAGDDAGALQRLAQAVAAAEPQGYVRVFVDEGPPMLALLDGLAAQLERAPGLLAGVSAEYVAHLRQAFGPRARDERLATPRLSAPGGARALVDPLSAREMEVLVLLAAGTSNQGIADALVLALDTVKKHVSHILEKLDATSRTQAVARARELELLD
jgi:LuxR family transcriptional regulator, maltose regulon positive regulatory protein